MRFCQRNVRKAKIFSNIIGVEESLVSYVTIETYKKISIVCCFFFVFFFLHVLVPACHPSMHALGEKKKRHKPGLNRYVLLYTYTLAAPRLLLKKSRTYEILSI